MNDQERLIGELIADPALAHATFFADKHKHKDAPFHRLMETEFHSPIPNLLWIIFRGAAKSTKLEEGAALEIGFQRIKNLLILGESEARAIDRLTAIKHIVEYNEDFQAAFQIEPGDPWQATHAVTSTGIMMQAAGRGQSLRGVKHLDYRPDLVLLDDIEDKESGSVATPEARSRCNARSARRLFVRAIVTCGTNGRGSATMPSGPVAERTSAASAPSRSAPTSTPIHAMRGACSSGNADTFENDRSKGA